MKRKHLRSVRLAVFVSIILFAVPQALSAPGIMLNPPSVPDASVSYGDNKTLTIPSAENNNFGLIGVFPDQALQINLQFPEGSAGQIIFVGLADGGTITTTTVEGALVVSLDGTVSFGFQAPSEPGEYRICFRFGTIDSVMPLYVLDSVRAARPQGFPTAN